MEMFLLTCEDLLVTIFFIVQTFFPPYNRFFLSSSEQAIDKMCRQTRAVRIRVRWRRGKGIPGASLGPWAQAPSSQGWAVLCPPALHPEAVSAERWMWEEDLLPGLGNLHPHLRNSSGMGCAVWQTALISVNTHLNSELSPAGGFPPPHHISYLYSSPFCFSPRWRHPKSIICLFKFHPQGNS